ncbi:MAG: hypothetical protein N3A69_06685 [Leptospiraceae bacterium]|nr:hypothetical protein [Leptospiraceae bacterium]
MGNPKKQEKSLFSYTPSPEELESFFSFLDNLHKEVQSATSKSLKKYSKKKTRKSQKKRYKDPRILDLPFESL